MNKILSDTIHFLITVGKSYKFFKKSFLITVGKNDVYAPPIEFLSDGPGWIIFV